MSHHNLRKERNCLNCGTIVAGRYCQQCGQENLVPQQSTLHFISHFINDIIHFDGKFFSTLNTLLFRPGYLPREFVRGRRASYLDPVRMYLFTSFIFFLIFFPFLRLANADTVAASENLSDTAAVQILPGSRNAAIPGTSQFHEVKGDTLLSAGGLTVQSKGASVFEKEYASKKQYDSLLNAGVVKDSWLTRQIIYKEIEIENKYKTDVEFFRAFVNKLTHNFPQLLFLSLPFTALILYLLHLKRRNYFYVAHGVFTIHLYIFIFILMLVGMGVSSFIDFTGWHRLEFIKTIFILLSFFYLYKAMRVFYGYGRLKTILKFVIFNILFVIINTFLFIIFAVLSLFQI